MPKVRIPQITVEMCNAKIADLEDENRLLREQAANRCIGLNMQQTVHLIALLEGACVYIRDHACPAHGELARDLLEYTGVVRSWFAASASEKFGEPAFDEALIQGEADRLLRELDVDSTQH